MQVEDDAQPIVLRCAPIAGAVDATLVIGGDDLGAPTVRLGDAGWEWQWQPRGRVGRWTLELRVHRRDADPVLLRSSLVVQPGKLDQAAYESLLAAIQRAAVGLVLDWTGGTIDARSEEQGGGPRSITEDYWTRLVAEAVIATEAAERLNRGPYGTWQPTEQERELHTIADVRPDMLARMGDRPLEETPGVTSERLLDAFPRGAAQKPRLPRTLPVRSMEPSVHRYEHAVLVRVVLELHARCVWVREAIGRELAWRAASASDATKGAQVGVLREWQRQVNLAATRLQRARTNALLVDVEPIRAWKGPTELMRRDRRYRAVAQAWQMLWQRPFVAVESPAYELPVDDLPALYERWCVLEVARALMGLGEPLDQQLFAAPTRTTHGIGPATWSVRLAEDRPLVRRRGSDGAEWRLWYHRRFAPNVGQGAQLGSLDPFLRVPDIVIEIVRPPSPPRLLIFDAKYRLTAAGNLSEEVLESAYAYHGGLGYAGIPASVGTYVLFPGGEGFAAGGVGAVPMIPGEPSSLQSIIERTLI